jgi:hypothetical protein
MDRPLTPPRLAATCKACFSYAKKLSFVFGSRRATHAKGAAQPERFTATVTHVAWNAQLCTDWWHKSHVRDIGSSLRVAILIARSAQPKVGSRKEMKGLSERVVNTKMESLTNLTGGLHGLHCTSRITPSVAGVPTEPVFRRSLACVAQRSATNT